MIAPASPLSATITTDTNGIIAGTVTVPVRDGNMRCYRAMPEGVKSSPIILVVQEIFGVHEYIKDVCRRFAKLGYMAMAPELYFRQGDASAYTDIPKLMQDIVSKIPDEQVMADLDSTVSWAVLHGGNAVKMSITGFCWGGRITWMYAAHNPALKAGVLRPSRRQPGAANRGSRK